jgi:tRNA(fMet)-specific endonuclease VapC
VTTPTRYLLDTNILSDLIRNPRGRITERIAAVGEAAVFTSIVVAAELRFGAAKRQSPALAERVETLLRAIEVAPLDGPADRHYAGIRAQLEAQGTPIGPNDLLIAAQALAQDAILVTANRSEFERVPELVVEDWLQA